MPPIPVDMPFSLYLSLGMLLAAGLVLWWGKISARQAGWRAGGWRAVLQGVGWGGVLAAASLAWLHFLLRTGRYLPIPVVPAPVDWIMLVLVIPAAEEIFFRGAVFAGLQRSWSLFWAVFLSALVSVLCLPMQRGLAFIFLGAVGYALAFRLSGSLVAPILAHMLVAVVFLLGRIHPGAIGALPPLALAIAVATAVALILAGLLARRAPAG